MNLHHSVFFSILIIVLFSFVKIVFEWHAYINDIDTFHLLFIGNFKKSTKNIRKN